MATWDEVDSIALSLPEVEEHVGGHAPRSWRVRGKLVCWERPLRPRDLEALGEAAPPGPILGVRVPDLVAKEALLAEPEYGYFTTPHFDGYPAVLIDLPRIPIDQLREAITESWLVQAPKRLSRDWAGSDDAG